MDADGSGAITEEELRQGFADLAEFRQTLADLDITEEDLEILWSILDYDRSGTVEYTEFVSQVYTMSSSDTQFMLAYIRFYVTKIRDTIVENIKTSEKKEFDALDKIEKIDHQM